MLFRSKNGNSSSPESFNLIPLVTIEILPGHLIDIDDQYAHCAFLFSFETTQILSERLYFLPFLSPKIYHLDILTTWPILTTWVHINYFDLI